MKYKTIPIGERILIAKDDDQKETKGGIILPDSNKIPAITGRVVEVSRRVENDPLEPIHKYDKVLLYVDNAIPVSNEQGNKLFIIHVESILAILEPVEETVTGRKPVGELKG